MHGTITLVEGIEKVIIERIKARPSPCVDCVQQPDSCTGLGTTVLLCMAELTQQEAHEANGALDRVHTEALNHPSASSLAQCGC